MNKQEYYQNNKEKVKERYQQNKEKISQDNKKRTLEARRKRNKRCIICNCDITLPIKAKKYCPTCAKEKEKEKHKIYQQRPATKERIKKYNQRPEVKERKKIYGHHYWYKKGVENREKRKKNQYKTELYDRIRRRLNKRFNRVLNNKASNTVVLIGCTIPQLKQYLETQFQPGMNWNNRGYWHIDHIVPCSSFDLKQPYEQKLCFNWFNLQPLWAEENVKKGSTYIEI